MKIKRMDITGFGKFHNKTVELENGINIIYGENESGKTTLHNFIDGMFYGFLKPNIKSTRYLEEHTLYEPWNKNRYAGIISFMYKDDQYRIEREFTKSKEMTKVYLESTGEEITNEIDTGSKTRILQPGYHFFGFNNNVFRNTISVKQLKTKTEKDLSKEIKEKLVNATHALDEKISVKNAIKSLDKDLKDIGSERAPTSIYGRTKDRIDKLKDEIRNISIKKTEYDNLLKESEILEEDYLSMKLNLDETLDLLKDIEYLELQSIYNKGIELDREIDGLEENIRTLSKYKDLNEEDYNEINRIINELNVIENSLEFKRISKEKSENKISELRKSVEDIDNGQFDEITKDYLDLEIMEEERNRLVEQNPKGAKSTYSENLMKYHKRRKLSLIGMGVVVVLFIILSMAIEMNMIIGLGSFIAFGILAVLFLKNNSQVKKEIKNIEYELVTKKIEDIDKEKERILNKHNVEYQAQLKDLYEGIKYKKFKKDETDEDIRNNEIELNIINDEISSLKEKKELNLEIVDNLLGKNSVLTIEDFDNGLKLKKDYEKNHSQLDNKKILYKRIMENYTLESLGERLQNNSVKHDVDIDSKDSILENKEIIETKISDTKLVIARNEINLNHLEEELNSMVLLEEELRDKENLVQEMDKEIAAIELAKSTIEDLSKDIHDDFAPHINKKVSNMIDRITKGKYNNIKVDDKLSLGILNPSSREILKAKSLSGGTIDQLYFSLRCGIISSISDENLPLILDDCFIQYDDYRLKNVLELLRDISKERQIILFTCHNREKEFLEEIDAKYNLITLT